MKKELRFGNRTFFPVVRTLGEMTEVVFDKRFLARASKDMELYFMFREVSKDEDDAKKIKARELRYDITIIPPNTLGVEFVKTAGHHHPYLPGSKLTYPEMYAVLEGDAHYLLQKREERDIEKITDIAVVKAQQGDKVIIPPNYGHVTINPADAPLKMANWVARTFSSIYEPIAQRGGAAYFELTTGEFIRNERYEEVPDVRFITPSDTWIRNHGLSTDIAMYDLLREPEKLAFLTNPADWFT
ncbi:MAG TPA: glucose-6-phosphate isomerase family protein [Desulfobacteria bacterium]|nr:glucose-6-phosphate isomerase family protein [Desulfobacteria bacterium]